MTIGIEHRQMGYDVDLPATVELDGTERLTYLELLRLVPGRRAVLRSVWRREGGETAVVVKAFFGRSARRRADREERGLSCLRVAEIPSPMVLARRRAADAEIVLLEDLGPVQPLDNPELAAVGALFEQMAACGIQHRDLHRANIVANDHGLFVLDGEAVRGGRFDATVALGRWLAEFPVGDTPPSSCRSTDSRPPRAQGIASDALATGAIPHRVRRAREIAAKVFRDTTAIRTQTTSGMRWCAVREVAIAPVDVERAFEGSANRLKSGGTATVVESDGLVIKRLNRKSWWHGARTSLRASRAAKSWANLHAGRALGLPLPEPVALLEHDTWGYRTASYCVYRFVAGALLDETVAAMGWRSDLIDAVVDLFARFRACRFTHGDCKASNYVVDEDGGLVVLDVDAATFHSREASFRKQFARDVERFLANWDDGAPDRLVERLAALTRER